MSILAGTVEEACEKMRRIPRQTSGVEIWAEVRLDAMANPDLALLLAARSVPVLVTHRRREEGGGPCAGAERDRVALLREAVALGADAVDIEAATNRSLIEDLVAFIKRRGGRTQLIVSHHDLDRTPPLQVLRETYRTCAAWEPDLVKIVTLARRETDNLRVLSLIAPALRKRQGIIAFCMGEEGRMSRVASLLLGAAMGYVAPAGGEAAAPGQWTLPGMERALAAFARRNKAGGGGGFAVAEKTVGTRRRPAGEPDKGPAPDLSACPADPDAAQQRIAWSVPEEAAERETAPACLYVLLGNPVAHSLSPAMHNAAYKAMGLAARYLSFCVADLAQAVAGLRGLGIRGASVTLPFKEAVIPLLDVVEEDARGIGAVNTVVNEGGRLRGLNTDWVGLQRMLRERFLLRGRTIAVLGAGGTARAAVFAIRDAGGIPVVLNRTRSRGEALARRFGCAFVPLSAVADVRADGLVNTTSVGMWPRIQETPLPASVLGGFRWVADAVYNPRETTLLREAKARGCAVVGGVPLFLYQGAAQIAAWTGREPPLCRMEEVVLARLEKIGDHGKDRP